MNQSNSTIGKTSQKPASSKTNKGLSSEEIAAMKDYIKEKKAAARRGAHPDEAEVEAEVLAKIALMLEPDRSMGKRIHALIRASVPALTPRLWYGMPAYSKDGKVICFFQPGNKFKTRYSTLGFNDGAKLDDGVMWPVAFALKELNAAEEARIVALVKKAAG